MNKDNKDIQHDIIVEKLSGLTDAEFLGLGNDGLSYIKPLGEQNGIILYALHGADGSHIATGQDMATLSVIAKQSHLIPMNVQ